MRRPRGALSPQSLTKRALAEALGVFALVFGGCGAIITDDRYDGAIGTLGIAVAFGLIVIFAVYATGPLSGGHINPAVTLALTITRQFPAHEAITYVGAQAAGASAGALTLLAVWPHKPHHLGATLPTVGVGSAFVYEFVLTAFLMFVIMVVRADTRDTGAAAAIAIGAIVGLAGLMAGPVTGASMNPARSFGPALVSGEWRDFWVYVAGPLLGGAGGAFAYQFFRPEQLRPLTVATRGDLPALPEEPV
jgi:aquaporin NIP